MRRWLPLLIVLAGACSHDHGPPRVRSQQHVDPFGPLRVPGPLSQHVADYKIDAQLDAVRHQLKATETLTWTNTGLTPVDALPFHLYLNAFKNEQSLFMRTSGGVMRNARASDNGWGWIQVDSVKIDGVELVKSLHAVPPDETVAELALPTPVAPGATVKIDFAFVDQLPEVFARTGYKGDFHMVGQWFPKIGVRTGTPGAEHWECQPLHAFSEFYADFGTYEVTLTVPTTDVVAATGVLVHSIESPGETRSLTYRAEDVHDFAWAADPFMDVLKGTAHVGDGPPVEVRVYYRAEQREFAKRHLDAAIGAIEKLSTWLTPYPYSLMSVVDPPLDAAAGAGGMEYPTLVTTAGDTVFARPGLYLPEYVTVHEVGHNWFQGMVATDEANDAWMDEGVNEWVDVKVMDELYGARTSAIDWDGWQAEIGELRRAVAADPASLPSPIATAASAFVDGDAYAGSTYELTMRAFGTLEKLVGTSRFMAAMRVYVRAWAFKHPRPADLFAMLSEQLGQDLTWFFHPVFDEVGGLRLAIRTAQCKPSHPDRGVFGDGAAKKTITETEAPDTAGWRCEVVVTSTGTMRVPVELELRFADGTSERERWDDHGGIAWKAFTIDRSARLTEVRLDPDGKILLDEPLGHAYRLDGDGAASLRAGARVASWAQLFMQVIGP